MRSENFTRTGHPLAVYFTDPNVRFSWDRIGDVLDEVRMDDNRFCE